MNEILNSLVGVGLYTVPEAARFTGVPTQSIRRWLFGYKYRDRDGNNREMSALWHGDIPPAIGVAGLSFLDLMEVRMVHAFRKHRVGWKMIREAAVEACEMYGGRHPFTLKRFRTDGNRIFADIIERGGHRLYDMNRKHYVLQPVVEPSLYEGIEFEQDQAARWFPVWAKRRVVLDPQRSFGQPILVREGIPTAVLAKAAEVEGAAKMAAKWYDVPESAVRTAVMFEKRLAV